MVNRRFFIFKMKRNVVVLKKNNIIYVPKFSECLLEYFRNDSDSVTVKYSLENEKLILNEDEEGYELRHSPECPMKLICNSYGNSAFVDSNLLKNDIGNTISVAASVVVESSDSHILLTKRTQGMRTSPNVWVTPGGHLEGNESIFSAGIREVKEETGLDIGKSNMKILGLWENVYPLILGAGKPKRHILIIYIHALLNEDHKKLTEKIIPNSDEVSSYCWLSQSTLTKLLTWKGTISAKGKQYIIHHGKIIEEFLDYNLMFNKWLWQQSQPYSGVNYALRKWIEQEKNKNTSSKI